MEAHPIVTESPPLPTTPTSLQALIRRLYEGLRGQMSQRFRRHVSFGDLFTDRWETASNLGFGAETSCYDNALILGDVRVGERCWIGPNVVLDGSGGLSIGDDCTISAGAQLYSHSSVPEAPGRQRPEQPRRTAPTRLGDRVYLGPQAVVAMGVSIGDDAIIGALSYVDRDVAAGEKVWGAPARPAPAAKPVER
jgi:acetyltransferase-like isoleucine patch superfamily enzyme